jgi:hypothetical protein
MHATGMRRGSRLLVPHPNAGRWKGFCHRLQRKKAPFLQHERHLLVATWFTKFRPPSMNYIPRHRAMTWNLLHRWGSGFTPMPHADMSDTGARCALNKTEGPLSWPQGPHYGTLVGTVTERRNLKRPTHAPSKSRTRRAWNHALSQARLRRRRRRRWASPFFGVFFFGPTPLYLAKVSTTQKQTNTLVG